MDEDEPLDPALKPNLIQRRELRSLAQKLVNATRLPKGLGMGAYRPNSPHRKHLPAGPMEAPERTAIQETLPLHTRARRSEFMRKVFAMDVEKKASNINHISDNINMFDYADQRNIVGMILKECSCSENMSDESRRSFFRALYKMQGVMLPSDKDKLMNILTKGEMVFPYMEESIKVIRDMDQSDGQG